MKHLLSISLLGPDPEAAREQVLDFIMESLMMVDYYVRNVPPPETLAMSNRKKRVLLPWFEEKSTRTIYSSEMAAYWLGNFIVLNPITVESSSLGKGETYVNTLRMMAQYGVTHVVVRSQTEGLGLHLAQRLEKTASEKTWVDSNVSIIVGGAGTRDHPTQALLDLVTIVLRKLGIRKKHEDLAKLNQLLLDKQLRQKIAEILDNLKLAIVGDLKHSRVAQSLVYMAKWFRISLMLIAPKDLMLDNWSLGDVKLFAQSESLAEAADCDFVYTIRLQLERLEKTLPTHVATEMAAKFMITPESLELLKGEIMDAQPLDKDHPMIAPELWTDERVIMYMQSAIGIPTRMAILRLTDACRSQQVDLLAVPPVPYGPDNIIRHLTLTQQWARMQQKYAGQQLAISSLRNGCVIDRIAAGRSSVIDRINIKAGLYGKKTAQVIRGRNMISASMGGMGGKEVVFIHDIWPSEELMLVYTLPAPQVRVSLVHEEPKPDGDYLRVEPPLPLAVAGIFTCPNDKCVTNLDPEGESYFNVLGKKKGEAHLQCAYCFGTFDMNQILAAFK